MNFHLASPNRPYLPDVAARGFISEFKLSVRAAAR
jgi:hypothetical protein